MGDMKRPDKGGNRAVPQLQAGCGDPLLPIQFGTVEFFPEQDHFICSQAVLQILGADGEKLKQSNKIFKERIHPEDQGLFEKFLEEVQSGKGLVACDFRIFTARRALRFLRAQGELTLAAKGESRRVLITVLDVTERAEMEDALCIAYQRLQDIIDFLPDATFVIDRDHTVVAWNRAIEKMTGTRKEDILGKGDYAYAIPFYGKRRPILIDLVGKQDSTVQSRYDIISEGDTVRAESFVKTAYQGKGAYLWGIAAPFYDHQGNWVGAIESIRDITVRKQAEEMLRQRTEKLEETNTALKVLLRESSETKEDMEKQVLSNIKKLVVPYLTDLKALAKSDQQQRLLAVLHENVDQLASSFTKTLSSGHLGFTPREIQIADLIRQGKSNKDIGELLKVSASAVEFHRRNMRDKLKIKGKKVNLRSYLLTMVG